jgi:hypothetical protein
MLTRRAFTIVMLGVSADPSTKAILKPAVMSSGASIVCRTTAWRSPDRTRRPLEPDDRVAIN